MRRIAVWIAGSWLLAAAACHAQEAPVPPVRVRGTVESFDGERLVVATRSDGAVTLAVPEGAGINGLERKSLADIADNVFVGTTAVRNAGGRWEATEVHIFPEAMRGAGEGHYAWDLPESTMTNAAVTGSAAARSGRTLRLQYAGGEVEVDVPADTPIVLLTQGSPALLVPGAAVFALAAPNPDGSANAVAIIAETNGVEPPM